jgi:hypothetical protein
MSEKKIYLGYSPKAKNIEKLAKYVEKNKTANSKTFVFKGGNPVLKNKRF